jgi:hypothetical protein
MESTLEVVLGALSKDDSEEVNGMRFYNNNIFVKWSKMNKRVFKKLIEIDMRENA